MVRPGGRHARLISAERRVSVRHGSVKDIVPGFEFRGFGQVVEPPEHPGGLGDRRPNRARQGRGIGGNRSIRLDFGGRPGAAYLLSADMGTGRGLERDVGRPGGANRGRRKRRRRCEPDGSGAGGGDPIPCDRGRLCSGSPQASGGAATCCARPPSGVDRASHRLVREIQYCFMRSTRPGIGAARRHVGRCDAVEKA